MQWMTGRVGLGGLRHLLLLVGACLLVTAPQIAVASPGPHPLFNDRGTLVWGKNWQESGKAALAGKRAVLVVLAHNTCGLCKEFVEDVVASKSLARRSRRSFIGCHVDARSPDKQLHAALVKHLPGGRFLPFVGAFDTKGKWLGGFVANERSTKATIWADYIKILEQTERHLGHPVEKAPAPEVAAPKPVAPKPQPPKPDRTVNGLAIYSNWKAARDAARASGKMIWVLTTKPKCTACEKMKDERLPIVAPEIGRDAIAYIYNILAPQSGRVDALLRAKLPSTQHMMPLWGFITHDVRWLSGDSGAPPVAEIRAKHQEAARNYRGGARAR